MLHWSAHLPHLTKLELLGPFLVRVDAWKALFASHPQLTLFRINQSPRFDLSCMQSLRDHCTHLRELRLTEVRCMSDEFVPLIAELKELEYLDLSRPGTSMTSAAAVDLLNAIGKNLTYLDLSRHEDLTDAFLTEGLLPNAEKLQSLILVGLPEITDAGVKELFDGLKEAGRPALHYLSLRRNSQLLDASLSAILSHSGPDLVKLDLNGLKDMSSESLLEIGKVANQLQRLDIGWCRNVDSFVVKAILDGCPHFELLLCFGCNKLDGDCPRKVSYVAISLAFFDVLIYPSEVSRSVGLRMQ